MGRPLQALVPDEQYYGIVRAWESGRLPIFLERAQHMSAAEARLTDSRSKDTLVQVIRPAGSVMLAAELSDRTSSQCMA